MSLSLRQVQQDKERRELREYQTRQREASRVTLGDLVGDVLAQHPQAAPDQPESEPAEAQPEPVAEAEPPAEPEPEPAAEPEPPADEDTTCSSSDSQGESPAEKAESPGSSD